MHVCRNILAPLFKWNPLCWLQIDDNEGIEPQLWVHCRMPYGGKTTVQQAPLISDIGVPLPVIPKKIQVVVLDMLVRLGNIFIIRLIYR